MGTMPAEHSAHGCMPILPAWRQQPRSTVKSYGFPMEMASESSGLLEELSEVECRQLLKTREVGRLAVVLDGQPYIFPVNYYFDGERIGIRTRAGTKLEGSQQRLVCFEVDDLEGGSHSGWDVVVQGVAHDVTTALDKESAAVRAMPIDAWTGDEKDRWIRIEPRLITGRRLVAPAP